MRIEGKTAVITGATGGIGSATARLFLDEGANLVLTGRSVDKLKSFFCNAFPMICWNSFAHNFTGN